MKERITIKRINLITDTIEYFTDDWSFITHTCDLAEYSLKFLKDCGFWHEYDRYNIVYIRIRVSPKIFVQL